MPSLETLFLNYEVSTGVYLFVRKERIVWHIIFALLLIMFVVGLFKLGVNSYHSFCKVFLGTIQSSANDIPNSGTQ